MRALVRICDGEARANSRDIAASFDRQHQHVLRSIDKLIEDAPEIADVHFWTTAFRQGGVAGKEHRAFDMDRDGFALLAMGFTGPKALRWKLAYIQAFNMMAEELRSLAANDAPAMTSSERLDFDEAQFRKLSMVREVRMIAGREAARRVWLEAGLPNVFDDPKLALPPPLDGRFDDAIRDWIEDRLELNGVDRIDTMDLYNDGNYILDSRNASG